MTKEELEKETEEFANNGYALGCTKTPFESAKEGYLAGFRAKTQWHDLRENHDDLPDTDRNVWVKRESESECQIDNHYDDTFKGWGIAFREGYSSDDVVAWCELPTFEE